MFEIPYEEYVDRVYGGWIGKSVGGTVGGRFEGHKGWITIEPGEAFPEKIPPNDDLDIQVLWLKVLEEKGSNFESTDLADAWLEWCWYPFNEYGVFRRNYRLGIAPPYSGSFNNEFFDRCMGSPIRSEIWGYVLPGAPHLAAQFARKDATLDHTRDSVWAEQMFSAMAADAFFVHDFRQLLERNIHFLPQGCDVRRLIEEAVRCWEEGVPLEEARGRLLALGGHPEFTWSPINVAFTVLGLLYGQGDFGDTLLKTLACGYDTDCTVATALAFLGQMTGAERIPARWKDPIGDELVMGIRYRRQEMTLSALARDTARVGARIARETETGVRIVGAPEPAAAAAPAQRARLVVDYESEPAAGPGRECHVRLSLACSAGSLPATVRIAAPEGWTASPEELTIRRPAEAVRIAAAPDSRIALLALKNIFRATVQTADGLSTESSFGVAGCSLWGFLGAYFDPYRVDASGNALPREQRQHADARHHFVHLDRRYVPDEENCDVKALLKRWTDILGRPAVIACPTDRVPVAEMVGLRGEYCAYLHRVLHVPTECMAWMLVGHNDGFRIWLNGVLAAESDQMCWWAPDNTAVRVQLAEGANSLLVKLLKRGERLDFSLAFRDGDGNLNCTDYLVNTADENPLLLL